MSAPLIEALLQAVIMLTAIVALLLLTLQNRHSRWGHVVGLLGQPAWLFSTGSHGQFGMFVVSLAFTAIYLWGIWKFWICPALGWPSIEAEES